LGGRKGRRRKGREEREKEGRGEGMGEGLRVWRIGRKMREKGGLGLAYAIFLVKLYHNWLLQGFYCLVPYMEPCTHAHTCTLTHAHAHTCTQPYI